jgi:hypothetical protein
MVIMLAIHSFKPDLEPWIFRGYKILKIQTGSVAHPASSTMDTDVLSWG